MKTIIITTSPQTTSITDFFVNLGRGFLKRSYQVVIIFDKQTFRKEDSNGLIYKTWPSFRPTKFKDFIFFKNIIKQYKPSYIIASFGAVNVSMIMGYFYQVPNRIAWNHTKSSALLKDSPNNFRRKLLRLRKIFILNTFTTEVHTNSKDNALDTHFYLKYPKDKIKVITFLLDKIQQENVIKEKIISFVGRFSPSKGQIILVKAIKSIIEEFPEYKFYFIGGGSTIESIQENVKKMGLKKYCVFTGNIVKNKVYEILEKSKLHVSASFDEAFGMVNLEAIALKTPILAHKIGGIPEILEDGVNGFFFNFQDSRDLSKKIKSILRDPELYARLQKGTEIIFEDKFYMNEKNLNKKIDLILNK